MSADELMRVWFDIRYTRFAQDYSAEGYVFYIKNGEIERTRKWRRFRKIIKDPQSDIDYKDLIILTYPPEVKGLAVLTWAHVKKGRQQDIWIWLPSIKRSRRVSQSNADDSFLGSDLTVEEVSTRRFGDETYELLGEASFPGYYSVYFKQKLLEGTACYKIKATVKRKDWYYTYRIVWLDKENGTAILDEYYDKRNRKFKTLFRFYTVPTSGCIASRLWECHDLRTDHVSAIVMGDTAFNRGLTERLFTVKQLQRTPW